MSIEDRSDYHNMVRGTFAMPPDKVFALFVSAINKSSFLQIVEGDESNRILKITSRREQDPKGLIEIKIKRYNTYEVGSYYCIRVNDELFIKDVHEAKRSLAPGDENTFVNTILSPIEQVQHQEAKNDKFGLFKP